MRVAVIGASGVLGRHLVPRLIERGHAVVAAVREESRARPLAAIGAEIRRADIFDLSSLEAACAGADAVVHAATAVPRAAAVKAGPVDWSRHDRIRREGTAKLLQACATAGVRRYVQQSIAMLHRSEGDAWVDEASPLDLSGRAVSAVEMEALVLRAEIDWCILRGGIFYGPGTGREEDWAETAQDGRLVIPGDGSAYQSLIHVADYASATVAAIESAPPSSVYLVVDDVPVTYAELYRVLAARAGVAAPNAGGPPAPYCFRASNARIKQALGWRPAYPSYRSGLA